MTYIVNITLPVPCYIDLGDYPKGLFSVNESDSRLWTLVNVESSFVPCEIFPSPFFYDIHYLLAAASHILQSEPHHFYLLHGWEDNGAELTEPIKSETVDYATFKQWCLEWRDVWFSQEFLQPPASTDPRATSKEYIQFDVLYKIVA